jgi:hypothetical protein
MKKATKTKAKAPRGALTETVTAYKCQHCGNLYLDSRAMTDCCRCSKCKTKTKGLGGGSFRDICAHCRAVEDRKHITRDVKWAETELHNVRTDLAKAMKVPLPPKGTPVKPLRKWSKAKKAVRLGTPLKRAKKKPVPA